MYVAAVFLWEINFSAYMELACQLLPYQQELPAFHPVALRCGLLELFLPDAPRG